MAKPAQAACRSRSIPVAPGLGKPAFSERLQQTIETATARLIAEGKQELAREGIEV